jgi:hypothetical protein
MDNYMGNFLKQYFLLILLFMSMVVALWKFPLATPIIAIAFLLVGVVVAISAIIKKHRESYHQGKITLGVFVRNVSVEVLGILLAVALAGLLGRFIAQMALEQIHHDSIKLIGGIIIGMLAGMSIGVLVKRTWGRLVKTSPD